jgi:hypothetical protein
VPVIDTVIAAVAAVGFVVVASSDGDFKPVGMIVEGGLTLGFAASALRGRGKVARCRAAMSLARQPPSPFGPPPGPMAPPAPSP